MHARRSVLGLILTLGLVVSGCGGGGNSDGESAAGGKKNPSSGENDINPVPRDELADGGTLTWAISELPPNFNVHHVDGTLGDNSDVMGGMLFGPFDFDANAEPIVRTEYVESAELTSEDPKQVVTYRVNPKATWYDGTPITVADFQAHWKANNGSNPAYKVASTQGDDKVESVEQGRDEREVIVTFREKYADWRGLFSALLPASTANDPAIFNDGWKEKPLTTAGPFKFESIDRTAQTITLVRNEKWWGRPAKLERIIYRVIDPDAQVEALANKEIDFIDVGPDVNKLQRAQSTPGVVLRKAGGPNFRHITINGRSPVLSDVKVRQAVAMAIDRKTIAKALLAPLGVPAEPLNNHIFMTNQKGYKDNAGDLGTVDLEKAAALLDEAGWTAQGATRTKDGKELVIRFVIPSGWRRHSRRRS